MKLDLKKYPFDPSGVSPDNWVPNEYHSLSHREGLRYRAFVLDHGGFYTDSVEVRNLDGSRLRSGIDYKMIWPLHKAVERTGLNVCSVIVLTNPDASDIVYVDYQAVGGEFTFIDETLTSLLTIVGEDGRAVAYENVLNKPSEYLPGGHLHALWELYGFGPYSAEVDRMIEALLIQSRGVIDKWQVYAQEEFNKVDSEQQAFHDDILMPHINNKSNPHGTNKGHLDLGLVNNYPLATLAQARDGTAKNRYMTPLRTNDALHHRLINQLTQHVGNKNNPHGTTAAKIGSYTKRESNSLLSQKLNRTATAVEAVRIGGRTYSQAYNEIRQNLSASEITGGRINVARLGSGGGTNKKILLGNGVWTSLAALAVEFNTGGTAVLYGGYHSSASAALNHISVTYNSYAVGTIVLYTRNEGAGNHHGNGNSSISATVLAAALKTGSGWVSP